MEVGVEGEGIVQPCSIVMAWQPAAFSPWPGH